MGTAENAEIVRRGYEAFDAGDMAALAGLFTADAVWEAAGSGPLSGTKQGRDAVLAYFGELAARSGGTFKVAVRDIIGGENHTVGLQHAHAERNGKTMDSDQVLVFEIRDGKVVRGQEFFADTALTDGFWA